MQWPSYKPVVSFWYSRKQKPAMDERTGVRMSASNGQAKSQPSRFFSGGAPAKEKRSIKKKPHHTDRQIMSTQGRQGVVLSGT